MTININMFDSFMKEEIWANMKSIMIITYECHLSDISKLQFFK